MFLSECVVLAGTEQVFFRVTIMRLCFGFVLKRVLIKQGFNYLIIAEHCVYRAKAFSASCSIPSARRLGMHKKLGLGITGTADLH